LLTIPNNFVANTLIQSALVDANFTAVATVINGNIDHSNTINSTGFYASDIKPLTAAEATFGLTATGVGYNFLANDATATPLTVSGVSGQSADLFDVTLTSGGIKAIFVDSGGALAFSKIGAFASGSSVGITGDIGAVAGMLFNIPTSSSSGYRWLVNGGTITPMQLTAAGNLNVSSGVGAIGAVIAGGATTGTPTPGDMAMSRSTTTGAMTIGGTAASVGIDFNITNPNSLTFRNASSAFTPIFAGAYTNSSDATLKTNVAPIADAITAIMALKPVSFDWKHDGSSSLGFLAQDVQSVFPVLVSTDVNGSMGVNYDGIIPVCVATSQEIVAKLRSAGIAGF
jgi:hypothetical protein